MGLAMHLSDMKVSKRLTIGFGTTLLLLLSITLTNGPRRCPPHFAITFFLRRTGS
jgi:hypothetical protein